jgi:hypothetical protein
MACARSFAALFPQQVQENGCREAAVRQSLNTYIRKNRLFQMRQSFLYDHDQKAGILQAACWMSPSPVPGRQTAVLTHPIPGENAV